MAGVNGAPDMVPIHKVPVQTSTGVGEALVIFNPTVEGTLPHPVYMLGSVVMSDDQVEALRRQISVYSTICKQLVDMHKATTEAQSSLVGVVGVGQHNAYDAQMGTPSQKTTARQRWTPSQSQLLILETLFDQGNGTPNKQRIKEITAELSHHGQIAETNVYNWFQNRKARAKRKQQAPSPKDGESEIDTDNDSPKDKKPRLDRDSGQEYSNSGGRAETGGHSSDGNGAYEQKPINVEQESASSGHLQHAHSEPKQPTAPATFGRSVSFNSGYTKSGTLEMSQLNMLADGGKRLDIPAGVLDLKSTFSDSALMMESHVPNIRAADSGITFPGLHAAEAYRLSSGLIDGGVSAPLSTDGMQVHNIHQVVGLLNNGLGNGSMLRMQAQI